MTAFSNRWLLAAGAASLFAAGLLAQPPADEKKKDEPPPTKEELALRQGSKNLAYKFKQGEEFHCEAKQKRLENRTVQGKARKDDRDLSIWIVLTVDKLLPTGGAELKARVDRVKYTRIDFEGVHKYDSNNPKNPEGASDGWELYASPGFQARFDFKVDARGKVSQIRPDSETDAFWKAQPRELRALVSDDVIRSLLPFFPLPSDLVRRGTDWKEKKTFLDSELGKRELDLDFSYSGSEQISGRTFEEIKIRAKAKLADPKPKFDLEEQHAAGKFNFDMERGNLHDFHFDQAYTLVSNLPDAPKKDDKKDKDKDKKDPKKGGGRGGSSGGGLGGYGSGSGSSSSSGYGAGMTGGGGSAGMMGKGGGRGGAPKKDSKKKDEDEDPLAAKTVKLELKNEVHVSYRGKPVAGE